jgi:hypothetical protein
LAVGVQTSGRPVTVGLLEGQRRTRRRNVTSDRRVWQQPHELLLAELNTAGALDHPGGH